VRSASAAGSVLNVDLASGGASWVLLANFAPSPVDMPPGKTSGLVLAATEQELCGLPAPAELPPWSAVLCGRSVE
jgi:hypothetical protein